jgi:peptide deformylase
MALSEERWDNEKIIGIVPVKDIPHALSVELENPSQLYKKFHEMENLCNVLNGVGLHAVQIGLPLDMYIVRPAISSPFEYYLNCSYQPSESRVKITSFEGCLSLRNEDGSSRYFRVERYQKIKIQGYRLVTMGKLRIEPVDMVVSVEDGIVCTAHQHEIDHGSGILLSDSGQEIYFY